MLTLSDRIEKAARWLSRSGIQHHSGGVHRWYREDTGCYAPTTTELTAYSISALMYLHKRRRGTDYARSICLGVRFIESCWNQQFQLMPFEPEADLSYFFDSGMIVRALRMANSPLAEDCAESMGRFVGDGTCRAILHMDGRPYRSPNPRWSTEPGCYQLKPAIWAGLKGIPIEAPEAFLSGLSPSELADRLHPACYYLEGLLGTDGWRQMENDIRTVSDAMALSCNSLERSDVLAQLLRLRLCCFDYGLPLDEQQARRELSRLLCYQVASDDVRTDGGFYFARSGGAMLPHVNPCSTAFALQAMQMWQEHCAGRLLNWKELI